MSLSSNSDHASEKFIRSSVNEEKKKLNIKLVLVIRNMTCAGKMSQDVHNAPNSN